MSVGVFYLEFFRPDSNIFFIFFLVLCRLRIKSRERGSPASLRRCSWSSATTSLGPLRPREALMVVTPRALRIVAVRSIGWRSTTTMRRSIPSPQRSQTRLAQTRKEAVTRAETNRFRFFLAVLILSIQCHSKFVKIPFCVCCFLTH